MRYGWVVVVLAVLAAFLFVSEKLSLSAATPDPPSTYRMVGQVGGPTQAVAVQGNYAYAGVGLRLVVLDISNPVTLTEVGSTTPFPYFVEDIVVSGTLAYVAAGGAGLRVVDIFTPTAPVEVGAWDSPGYAEGVAVAGNTVYLADGPYGLWTVDVSDQAHPLQVGSAYDMNYAFEVTVADHHAYIAAAGAGLLVADVSDPAHPVEVDSLDTPGYAYGVAVSGNTVYVADAWEGVWVVDVSNPANPVELGACDTAGWALNVAVTGGRAYVADGANGLRVVDVSNPVSPHEIGAYEILGLARRVAVADGKAFVADTQGGLRLVNVADATHPVQVSLYAPLAEAARVAVAGDYAYVAAGFSGLRVVDVSDPAHPKEVATYDTEGAYAADVVVSDDYAYLATFIHGPYNLHVLDISDPAHPTRVSTILQYNEEYKYLALIDDTLYVCIGWGLQLIDVSDPTAPAKLGFIPMYSTTDIAVSGTLAYVADDGQGVKIVDVSDPLSPTLVSVYDSSATGVAVEEDKLYVTVHLSGLQVVDVSDPKNPVEIGFYDTPGQARTVTVSGMEAYVSDGGGGMVVVDVSNPFTPTLLAAYDTAGQAWHTALAGGYTYVADGRGGLVILERTAGDSASRFGDPPLSAPSGPAALKTTLEEQRPWRYGGTPADPVSFSVSVADAAKSPEYGAPALASACVVTSTTDSGAGTLRICLENAVSGTTVIFDPLVFPPTSPVTIALSSELPSLTQGQVTIDASNAGVILDGRALPEQSNGLTIDSDYNVIRGLQILYVPGYSVGIDIYGALNVIGGDRALGTGPVGQGNLIGSNYYGIRISGINAVDNTVTGNMLGTNLAGNAAIANMVGIEIREGASRNHVGGATSGERNIISGNQYGGIQIVEEATNNVVAGNLIGTKAGGAEALGNAYGVSICCRASHNRVGGTIPAERNYISGNREYGIDIAGNGATGNVIVGNYIGTDIEGTHALGNAQWGVIIWDGPYGNTVGGTGPGEGNLISSNWTGVAIAGRDANQNAVIGNLIGTDATGQVALGNSLGIALCGAASFSRVEGNVISGNGAGISACDEHTLILGNYIGADVSGTQALGNGTGIGLGGRHVLIGGTTAPERNVIVGNQSVGIDANLADAEYNWIAGNTIGTDASGTIPLGNGWAGVGLWDYSAHAFIRGNTIAFNGGSGWDAGVFVEHSLYNAIRRNSIYSNIGAGIVLGEGGNNLLPAPVITAVTATGVSGMACPGCTVEIFSDTEDEGRVYEGDTVAGPSGAFAFTKGSWLVGPYVTATATDSSENTSEFSLPQVVWGRIYLPVILKAR